ncbi:MAG: hypothetical protein ACOY0T_15195 [Myxococcota bacterium]
MRSYIKATCSLIAIANVLSACSGENPDAFGSSQSALSSDPSAQATATNASSAIPLPQTQTTTTNLAADELMASLGNFELIKQNATSVQFSKLNEGVLQLDATEGKVMLPVPQKARTFATQKEFVAFAKEQLGAVEVFDKEGNLTGLQGTVEQFGVPVMLDDANKSVTVIEDPIAAFLGGNDGFVTIEGKDLCLTDQCASEKGQFPKLNEEVQPLGSRMVCSGSLCLHGGTYKNQYLNYHRGGAWTDVSGVHILCTWFGWFCPTAADELYGSATYVKSNGGRWGFQESRVPRTSHVEVSRWAIDWWIFGRSGDWDLVDTVGVCGRHTGRRGNDTVSFSTSEGNTFGSCP